MGVASSKPVVAMPAQAQAEPKKTPAAAKEEEIKGEDEPSVEPTAPPNENLKIWAPIFQSLIKDTLEPELTELLKATESDKPIENFTKDQVDEYISGDETKGLTEYFVEDLAQIYLVEPFKVILDKLKPPSSDENALPSENEGEEQASTEGETKASTSGEGKATTVGGAKEEGEAKATTSGETKATTSGETKATTSGETKATTSGEAPATTSGEAPATTSGEAPATTSGEQSVTPEEKKTLTDKIIELVKVAVKKNTEKQAVEALEQIAIQNKSGGGDYSSDSSIGGYISDSSDDEIEQTGGLSFLEKQALKQVTKKAAKESGIDPNIAKKAINIAEKHEELIQTAMVDPKQAAVKLAGVIDPKLGEAAQFAKDNINNPAALKEKAIGAAVTLLANSPAALELKKAMNGILGENHVLIDSLIKPDGTIETDPEKLKAAATQIGIEKLIKLSQNATELAKSEPAATNLHSEPAPPSQGGGSKKPTKKLRKKKPQQINIRINVGNNNIIDEDSTSDSSTSSSSSSDSSSSSSDSSSRAEDKSRKKKYVVNKVSRNKPTKVNI